MFDEFFAKYEEKYKVKKNKLFDWFLLKRMVADLCKATSNFNSLCNTVGLNRAYPADLRLCLKEYTSKNIIQVDR